KEGETVPVNTVVAVIDGDGSKPVAPSERAAAPAPAAEPPRPAPTAQASGDQARQGGSQAAARAETKQERRAAPEPTPAGMPVGDEELIRTRSSPLVRKIAAEHGVDISQIEGTGLAGRVTKNDILSYIENQSAPQKAPAAPIAPAIPGTQAAPGRGEPVPARPQ